MFIHSSHMGFVPLVPEMTISTNLSQMFGEVVEVWDGSNAATILRELV